MESPFAQKQMEIFLAPFVKCVDVLHDKRLCILKKDQIILSSIGMTNLFNAIYFSFNSRSKML